MMSGIEPEEEIYIYIYKQRVGGLAVEEKTMKVIVALVLVGSSATHPESRSFGGHEIILWS